MKKRSSKKIDNNIKNECLPIQIALIEDSQQQIELRKKHSIKNSNKKQQNNNSLSNSVIISDEILKLGKQSPHKTYQNYICYLECIENNSSKYYFIQIYDEIYLFCKWGKIGTNNSGTSQTFSFENSNYAITDFLKKVKEKVKKNYNILEGFFLDDNEEKPILDKKQHNIVSIKQAKLPEEKPQIMPRPLPNPTEPQSKEIHFIDYNIIDYQNYQLVAKNSIYMECTDKGSFKFYLIQVIRTKQTPAQFYVWTRWGKISSTGQSNLDFYPNESAAVLQMNTIYYDKMIKNYQVKTPSPEIFSIQIKTLNNNNKKKKKTPVKFKGKARILKLTQKLAYIPVCNQRDSLPWESKFCGKPYIPLGQEYPKCINCNQYLIMFMQIDLQTLPKTSSAPESGLLQMFYCGNEDKCGDQFDSYEEFSASHLIRIIPKEQIDKQNYNNCDNINFDLIESMDEPKAILHWRSETDLPTHQEQELLGIDEEDYVDEDYEYPIQGEKYLGWPTWVQDVEYVKCHKCNQQMDYLFQIDSNHNINYQFGDCGVGHISICKTHKDVLAFRWACS